MTKQDEKEDITKLEWHAQEQVVKSVEMIDLDTVIIKFLSDCYMEISGGSTIDRCGDTNDYFYVTLYNPSGDILSDVDGRNEFLRLKRT